MNLFQFLNPTIKPPKDALFERFLEKVNAIFGSEPEFWLPTKQNKNDDLVVVVIYRDVPGRGFLTAVTYGLSLDTHPLWKQSRPELCILVKSENENWAKALGHLVSRLRGACPFVNGQIIRFGAPIVEESDMNAFWIWEPLFLEKEEKNLNIDGSYSIHLQALYPIQEAEILAFETLGAEALIKHPNFDPFNVSRAIID
ncbi:suppressor of fused domain protein [Flavobacterium sp. HSC-61S13]|uniref:suppressor of fused domain protein n=1 Tax=Flavobacterium sp. HSC-61S13 TaxID=2910963 RepID=UPI0020A20974|nr:suppressor of fused domain protein [Flavobacterium sp. HSC-61S13]MCP1995959.1 hypothetical protein [Flavobacterium sp. HSC-61S13]